MPEFDSQEIGEFVKATLEGIEKGLIKDYQLSGEVKFELAVVNVKRGEGGFKLLVVDAKGGASKENVSKIKFKISKPFHPGVAVLDW